MVVLSERPLDAARARIAALLAPELAPVALGSIELRASQRALAGRVCAMLSRHGGCLLADDVGRGKTFVALAVAREFERPMVVIPASLRATWSEATRRAGCSYEVITHEGLSLGQLPDREPDFVIVDESHRFRNPATRRHAALARVVARCPVLMLSATPIQNAARDLAAQLSLFLGSGAFGLDVEQLARYVVRGGDESDAMALPRVAPPCWVRPPVDDGEVLRAIMALPAPPRARDMGDAGALRTIALVRAWASSRAALRSTLATRRRLAAALEQSIEGGRLPARRELEAWRCEGGADVQLGFVPLLVEELGSPEQLVQVAREIAAEREACAALEDALRHAPDPDVARCAALRALREAHPGERLLCFSELATTVRACYAALRGDPGVAMLTAAESRIASGRLPRDELLALFSPTAQGARQPVARERVTLLLATDLLSEGVNLQDASVVVHLDLPWNPARLTQRLGRVRRAGGAAVVSSYLIAPPAESEMLLQVEDRLRRKLACAAAAVGASMMAMPTLTDRAMNDGLAQPPCATHSAAARGRMLERIARWGGDALSIEPDARLVVAGVLSHRRGWLAAFGDGRLVASLDGAPPDDGRSVAAAVALAEGEPRAVDQAEGDAAIAAAERWLRAREAAEDAGARLMSSPAQRLTLSRAAELLARVPRHARGPVLPLVATLREALARPIPLGMERELGALPWNRTMTDVDAMRWLRSALRIVQRLSPLDAGRSVRARIAAVIVLGGDAADARSAVVDRCALAGASVDVQRGSCG